MTLSGFSTHSKALLKSLSKGTNSNIRSPCFRIGSNKVSVLDSPQDYYSNIINGIKKSEKRIILCSLYLGTGEKERELIQTIEQQLRAQPALKVYFYFDKNRASRGERDTDENATDKNATEWNRNASNEELAMETRIKSNIGSLANSRKSPMIESMNIFPDMSQEEKTSNCDLSQSQSAAEESLSSNTISKNVANDSLHSSKVLNPKSSLSLLKPLLKYYYSQVYVILYEPPIMRHHSLYLSRLLPERVNEALGVQHMKIYLFDDDVMLSGANLSDWYFENRHDRWHLFREQPELCNFYERLCRRVMTIGSSYQVIITKELKKDEYINDATGNILYYHYIEPRQLGSTLMNIDEESFLEYEANHKVKLLSTWSINWKILKNTLFKENLLRKTVQHWWNLETERKLLNEDEINNQKEYTPPMQEDPLPKKGDIDSIHTSTHTSDVATYLFPTLQIGCFHFHNDRDVTKHLLQSMDDLSKSILSSAYFNFTNDYANVILASKCKQIDVVTSSPRCNGFFGSKGISGYIPNLYSLMERMFFQKVKQANKNDSIQILEYRRDDEWTYHAKGLWFIEDEKVTVTMVGSSNFGQRSVDRDLESQVVLITQDEALQKSLYVEQQMIENQTSPIRSEKEFEHADRQCSGFLAFLTRTILRKFL